MLCHCIISVRDGQAPRWQRINRGEVGKTPLRSLGCIVGDFLFPLEDRVGIWIVLVAGSVSSYNIMGLILKKVICIYLFLEQPAQM